MTKTNVVSITQARQFAFPPEILATLEPGDEYLLWQTDDTIVLKKITQPISFDKSAVSVDVPDENPTSEYD